ncbi:hypothetical protein ACFQZC_02100 [Streptacidiphilus monticola]
MYAALTNPLAPWRVEVLDGLVWKEGKPLDEWSRRLKSAWSQLTGLSHTHADPGERTAAYLASRAVRSILLFGIGGFAARPGWSPAACRRTGWTRSRPERRSSPWTPAP